MTVFESLIFEKDQISPGDSECKVLFYIISKNEDLYQKVNGIYDFEKVDFSDDLSAPNPSELFSVLDENNFRICINALFLRFGFEE